MRDNFKLIAMALFLFLASCVGSRTVSGIGIENALPISQVLTLHQSANPRFNTLASRVQVVYDDGKRSQSITVSLRMEKDQTIWMKASILGITLAKILITPDKVSYYETISNTYFEGNFELLSDWLGTELDFEKTQAILLGQSIFKLNKDQYKLTVINNKYKLEPRKQPFNFIHSIFLNPDNYKMVSGSLSQPNDDRLLSLRYGDYQQVEGSYYPSDILIDATQKEEKTKITVIYKSIDINPTVSFPFSIPEGFEQIQLTK